MPAAPGQRPSAARPKSSTRISYRSSLHGHQGCIVARVTKNALLRDRHDRLDRRMLPVEQDYHDKMTGDMPAYFMRAFTGSFTFSNFSISTLRNWPFTFSTRRM